MKKNLLTVISLVLLILFSSCSTYDNSVSFNNVIEEPSTSTIETETQPESTSIITENRGMSEQEIMNLGEKQGNILKKLYFDYLDNYSIDLAFKTNYMNIKKSLVKNVVDGDTLISFYLVESDQFKTYSQLNDYFCTFCTPEYSMELLTRTTNIFRDIDGELYVCYSERGFTGYISSNIVTYDGIEDSILYYCTALGDDSLREDYAPDNPIHDHQYDKEFTFTVKKIEGEWYLDSCSDISLLVHTWYTNDN